MTCEWNIITDIPQQYVSLFKLNIFGRSGQNKISLSTPHIPYIKQRKLKQKRKTKLENKKNTMTVAP